MNIVLAQSHATITILIEKRLAIKDGYIFRRIHGRVKVLQT